ncbi:unnamed protein product [Triticum turgidum subsp. durum]|uniref:DUF1618 domain-containing protein n=1 Tax=Triticum turgidum subsp. durum TaxID=4567 RepID=A0A9R0XKS2_TRITD|nr:unnamed protein product [Triticum turgidum subsp. durum]
MLPMEAGPSSDEEETVVLSDWKMAEEEEEEETDVFTDWAMEEAAVFPDWAMLDRMGCTRCHKDLDAARLVVSKNKTAARLRIDRGCSCYVSFTLAAPQGVSYLNLHWPVGEGSDAVYALLRATDKDLVLFDIYDPSRLPYLRAPAALFVYTAAGPSPSVQRLPMYAKDRKWRHFLKGKFTTGILRLPEKRFIVADLCVLDGALCVFNSSSEAKDWKVISITPGLIRWHTPEQNKSSSGQLPNQWSTDDALAFDGRFLCWVDYFSGVLLSDFSSTIGSPTLHFVPFPGEKEYPAEVRVPREFPGRFRNVSISQGKMRFVHIDNDFHETIEDDWPWRQLPERRSQGQQHQGSQKITIWTLNSDKFKWEQHGVINLDCLWAQRGYEALGIRQRLPEFPIVSVEDPDVLCCLLREEEFNVKGWMIMVDMKHAYMRSCTPYINRHSYCAKCADVGCAECVDARNDFPNTLLLPTVFSKHLERPTGS